MNIEGLCVVLTEAECIHYSWEDILNIVLNNNIKFIQLREKNLATFGFYNLAVKAKRLTDKTAEQVKLIINGRIDIALSVDAGGAHVRKEDIPYKEARRFMGHEKIIVVSADTIEDVILYNQIDCDYVGISGIFSSTTKDINDHLWGKDGLKAAWDRSKNSLVAIGGLNKQNIKEIMPFCDSVAVVSVLCSAKNPDKEIKDLIKLVKK